MGAENENNSSKTGGKVSFRCTYLVKDFNYVKIINQQRN